MKKHFVVILFIFLKFSLIFAEDENIYTDRWQLNDKIFPLSQEGDDSFAFLKFSPNKKNRELKSVYSVFKIDSKANLVWEKSLNIDRNFNLKRFKDKNFRTYLGQPILIFHNKKTGELKIILIWLHTQEIDVSNYNIEAKFNLDDARIFNDSILITAYKMQKNYLYTIDLPTKTITKSLDVPKNTGKYFEIDVSPSRNNYGYKIYDKKNETIIYNYNISNNRMGIIII